MDLRVVRTGLERADVTTNFADAARAEIGRAIAEKIKELKTGRELRRLTSEVLPQLDKFLESAEEKRLRRMRAGVITSAIGLGVTLMFMIVALASGKETLLGPAAAGLIAFIIGVGILINGKVLTVPKKKISDSLREIDVLETPGQMPALASGSQTVLNALPKPPLSVVEHTTHRLSTDPAAIRDRQVSIQHEE